MIKPVYFGKNDKRLFDYVNEIDDFNFSDWVKEKIKERMGIVESKNTKDVEILIRMILKENGIIKSKEGEEGEAETIAKVKMAEIKEDDVFLDGWIL